MESCKENAPSGRKLPTLNASQQRTGFGHVYRSAGLLASAPIAPPLKVNVGENKGVQQGTNGQQGQSRAPLVDVQNQLPTLHIRTRSEGQLVSPSKRAQSVCNSEALAKAHDLGQKRFLEFREKVLQRRKGIPPRHPSAPPARPDLPSSRDAVPPAHPSHINPLRVPLPASPAQPQPQHHRPIPHSLPASPAHLPSIRPVSASVPCSPTHSSSNPIVASHQAAGTIPSSRDDAAPAYQQRTGSFLGAAGSMLRLQSQQGKAAASETLPTLVVPSAAARERMDTGSILGGAGQRDTLSAAAVDPNSQHSGAGTMSACVPGTALQDGQIIVGDPCQGGIGSRPNSASSASLTDATHDSNKHWTYQMKLPLWPVTVTVGVNMQPRSAASDGGIPDTAYDDTAAAPAPAFSEPGSSRPDSASSAPQVIQLDATPLRRAGSLPLLPLINRWEAWGVGGPPPVLLAGESGAEGEGYRECELFAVGASLQEGDGAGMGLPGPEPSFSANSNPLFDVMSPAPKSTAQYEPERARTQGMPISCELNTEAQSSESLPVPCLAPEQPVSEQGGSSPASVASAAPALPASQPQVTSHAIELPADESGIGKEGSAACLDGEVSGVQGSNPTPAGTDAPPAAQGTAATTAADAALKAENEALKASLKQLADRVAALETSNRRAASQPRGARARSASRAKPRARSSNPARPNFQDPHPEARAQDSMVPFCEPMETFGKAYLEDYIEPPAAQYSDYPPEYLAPEPAQLYAAPPPQHRSTSRQHSRGRSRQPSPAPLPRPEPHHLSRHHPAPSRESSYASVHSFQQLQHPGGLQPEASFGRSSAAGSYGPYHPHPAARGGALGAEPPAHHRTGGYLDSLTERGSGPKFGKSGRQTGGGGIGGDGRTWAAAHGQPAALERWTSYGSSNLHEAARAFEQESQQSWGSEGTEVVPPPPPPPPMRQQGFQPYGRGGYPSRDSSPGVQQRRGNNRSASPAAGLMFPNQQQPLMRHPQFMHQLEAMREEPLQQRGRGMRNNQRRPQGGRGRNPTPDRAGEHPQQAPAAYNYRFHSPFTSPARLPNSNGPPTEHVQLNGLSSNDTAPAANQQRSGSRKRGGKRGQGQRRNNPTTNRENNENRQQAANKQGPMYMNATAAPFKPNQNASGSQGHSARGVLQSIHNTDSAQGF